MGIVTHVVYRVFGWTVSDLLFSFFSLTGISSCSGANSMNDKQEM